MGVDGRGELASADRRQVSWNGGAGGGGGNQKGLWMSHDNHTTRSGQTLCFDLMIDVDGRESVGGVGKRK